VFVNLSILPKRRKRSLGFFIPKTYILRKYAIFVLK